MNNDTELLVLRLALIAIIFLFVFGVALMMRSGVASVAPSAARPSRATRRVSPRLVVLVPARTSLTPGDEFDLPGTMSIGRDGGNGIVLADPSVSGRHAAIERTRTGWRLTDLGSTNGTLVDGRAVDGRGVLLTGGEQVSLGSVVLRFQP
ncbi:MAG TPA: FHA domain-containing protein [Tepidiformaceae bacterium]|nr:FHA domain-containing protein [Tepidiformaceae bacterium]